MADTPDKLVTAESIKALHDYNKKTYSDVGHTHNTLVYTNVTNNVNDNLTLNSNGFKSTCDIGANINDLDYEMIIKNQIDGMRMSYKDNITDDYTAHITAVKGGIVPVSEGGKTIGYGSELSLNADSSGISTSILLRDYSREVLDSSNNYLPSINFQLGNDIGASFILNENEEFDFIDGNGKSVIRPCTNNGNLAIGYGGYGQNGEDGTKTTNIYGKTIKVWSNAAGLEGREYGVNKLLWGGVAYMGLDRNGDKQTISLNEAVSAQPNGIVLMWSAYSDGKARDYNWHYNFIPKRHIKYHAREYVNFFLCTSGFSYMSGKYLAIDDKEIIGHDSNDNAGTSSSGIKYNNKHFVLRGVIGV